jgi:hypothetical protein
MAFLSTSTTYDGVYWGEAPQLSGTYGQYDNGASVFSNYQNFKSTPSSGWTASSSMTVTGNNGLTLTSSAAQQYYGFNTNLNGPLIVEQYGKVATEGTAQSEYLDAVSSSADTAFPNYWSALELSGSSNFLGYSSSSGNWATTTTPWSVGTFYLLTVAESSLSGSFYNNYGLLGTASSGLSSFYFEIFHGLGVTSFTYWFRTRAYPPNNVMPSTSLSIVTPATTLLVSIYVTGSSGSVTSTIASNVQSPAIGSTEAQYAMTFAGGQVNIPANGYLMVSLSAGVSSSYIVYWGKGQPTNFQVPYRLLT